MAFARYLSLKKSVLFMVAGLIVFVIYLYFFIGIPQIATVLSRINSTQYITFYLLALAFVLASVYLYYWVGYFTDLVVPCATVCGELTRLYLV